MAEERLKLAVFIDFDNIQIGVKDTLGRDFDVAVVLEALKERGEVVTKIAYGDWHRAGEHSRQMTQHAVQMVQRNVTPRGDKNGADINLALDALEMAFTRHHIGAFAIVGGDSDFIALVEKLKQYDKRVFVVGGRAFTSNILQRNCHEFIAYENLIRGGDGARAVRSTRAHGRPSPEGRPLSAAFPNLQRALKMLAEREVAPQIGLLKSTLLQLDPTFTERDYGASSFLEFVQKMAQANLLHLRRVDRGYLVDLVEGDSGKESASQTPEAGGDGTEARAPDAVEVAGESSLPGGAQASASRAEAVGLLKQAVAAQAAKAPNRPLYMRHMRQGLRAAQKGFDEKRYGFRSILDLLHQAEREDVVRLSRDRKGVLRIFPVPSSAPPSAPTLPAEEPAAGALEAPVTASAPAVYTEAGPQESFAPVELFPAEPGEMPAEVVEESGPAEGDVETPVEIKPRRPRPARGTGKSGQRRTSSRRKPKEPSSDE